MNVLSPACVFKCTMQPASLRVSPKLLLPFGFCAQACMRSIATDSQLREHALTQPQKHDNPRVGIESQCGICVCAHVRLSLSCLQAIVRQVMVSRAHHLTFCCISPTACK